MTLYPETEGNIEQAAHDCLVRIDGAVRVATRNGSARGKIIAIASKEMLDCVRNSSSLTGSNSAVAGEKLHNRILQLLEGRF